MKARQLSFLLALAAAATLPAAAPAQQPAWPNRVVRIIATSPPGGSIDFLARTIAEDFGKSFGQPFIVENRPGANGNIGVDLVVKAPADGHMLFVTAPGPFSINLNLYDSMPFNPGADIAPVALLAVAPLVLVVHPSVPARNVKELVAFLRSQRGGVNYASQAVGATGHLAMELFKSLAGFEATPWLGLGTRAGTPREIVGRLNDAATRALTRAETVGRMALIGIEPRPMTAEQFADFVRAETVRWGEIIRRSGAKAE